jgi:uncharacterized membrane protein (Fun14 family)
MQTIDIPPRINTARSVSEHLYPHSNKLNVWGRLLASDITFQDVLPAILFQASGGLILGFAVGYAAKKALKIALIVLGVFTAGLIFLEYQGIISVNYDKLALLVERLISGAQATAASLEAHILANVPFASTFLLGFAMGFKYG